MPLDHPVDGQAILAIDEGTTGTRAALVGPDGTASHIEYLRLAVDSPAHGVVEQDAAEIWTKTLEVCRAVLGHAQDERIEIVGVAIAAQRGTAVLWDSHTGRPLVPAMVWQDTRYAEELGDLATGWSAELLRRVGRPTGVRSPYLWAAHHLDETPAVTEASAAGGLQFGTVDSWLIWNLTDGSRHVSSATIACSAGAYELEEHRYAKDYIETLGFPAGLLPELRDDAGELGRTSQTVLGIAVPILAAMGDQHAGIVGLGSLEAGQAMCVHGTGSFVDLVTGPVVPPEPGAYEGVLSLVGWRAGGISTYSVEAFTATTGSALDWICHTLGWFDSAVQISELAGDACGSGGITFVPALTGLRMPIVEPGAAAVLSGLTTASSRAELAHAILEGIAHSVADSLDGTIAVSGLGQDGVHTMNVGGGLSASDPLMQLQADLTGLTMRRLPHSDTASLRGVAYLAASNGLFWNSLDEALATTDTAEVFIPACGEAERRARRNRWRRRLAAELDLAN